MMNFIILFNALCMCFDIYPPYVAWQQGLIGDDRFLRRVCLLFAMRRTSGQDDTVLLILDNINFLCSVIFFFEAGPCVQDATSLSRTSR